MKNNEAFREFVNENLSTDLTTQLISRRAGIHIRLVQGFCKKVRGNTRKVRYTKQPSGTIVYTFKKPLSKNDI